MMDLVGQNEVHELDLRHVTDRSWTGEELHRAEEILVARRLQRRHDRGVILLERRHDFAPRLRRLRKTTADLQLVLERRIDEIFLDRERPHELARVVGPWVRLEL